MSKITYEQKITALDFVLSSDITEDMKEVYRAIKADVIRVHSKGGGRASSKAESTSGEAPKADNTLYNSSMGVYRKFLSGRNSHLDMSGRKAFDNKRAMDGILKFLRDFMKSNEKPHGDADVLIAVEFLFNQENWNRLNDYHRNRIKLPDIWRNIEEILPMMRNGHDTKSAAKNNLQSFKQRLTQG